MSTSPTQRYPLPQDPVQAVRLLMNGLLDTQQAIAELKAQQSSANATTTTQIIEQILSGKLPITILPLAHYWLNSYDSITGAFTSSQPAAADLSDTPTSGNVLRGNGTAFVSAQLAAADLSNGTTGSGAVVLADSPALTTAPTSPTQTATDSSTKIATTAFVKSQCLTGTSGNLGGSAMTSGQRITITVAVTGATTAMVANCSPVADPGAGFVWHAYVSSADTVTVCLTCVAAGTPSTTTYNVRVLI